jgi:hypothetical protein
MGHGAHPDAASWVWTETNVFTTLVEPNVVVEWFELLFHIREVQISARRPAILTEVLVVFVSPSGKMTI